MTGTPRLFGPAAPGRVLAERPIVALDIGARRGFTADQLPIAAALAGEAGRRDLHLTQHGGTSSMLAAIPGIGARYMRDDYFSVERTVTVDTLTLDDALDGFGIGNTAYIKIDVEGMEKAIFEGGSRTLDHVLGGAHGGCVHADPP